jgi:AraC family transcriptional regulator
MAGAEAAGNVQADGYATFILSSGEYAVCCFEAESFTELIGSAIYKAFSFMNSWMKKHNLTCGNFVAEMYYGTAQDSNYMELWLPFKSYKMGNETWDKTNGTQKPSMETINAYVDSPLFEGLCKYVESEYKSKPVLDYSRCSMQCGWNVKYKKSGRTLCTLYPMEGYFIALIVISDREKTETEFMLPFCTKYLQQLYHETRTGIGQKWLMINVTDDAILEDVKQLIAIRRGKK